MKKFFSESSVFSGRDHCFFIRKDALNRFSQEEEMKHHRVILLIMFSVIILFLTGCASTPNVKRIDVDKIVDISGRWNDTDSGLVAEDMISDCLKRPFLERSEFIANDFYLT